VAGEEVVDPGKVVMLMNMFKRYAMLDVTGVVEKIDSG